MSNRQDIDKTLGKLFDAERETRRLHDELSEQSEDDVLAALSDAHAAATKEPEDECTMRLVRIASLLGEFTGARVVDALIDILSAESPEARASAGEQLEELAFDRFKEVAEGVERALKRLPVGAPALPELPYLLAEIPEPGVQKLVGMFLAHEDADAVAAGIEVLTDIGDPASAKLIKPLLGDKRTVEIAEEGGEGAEEVTLGELAEEAVSLLQEDEGGDAN